jgi:cytochrome c biogenesis protein ResB
MIELIRTDDPVLLSWLETRLAEVGIETVVFDGHTSSAYAGALDSVSSRMMVAEEDLSRAMRIVAEGRGLAGQE